MSYDKDRKLAVKPGDEVVFYYGAISMPRLETVERITPSGQIAITGHYSRFYPDGREIGQHRRFSTTYIVEATPEAREAMARTIERRKAERYSARVHSDIMVYVSGLSLQQKEELLLLVGLTLPAKD